MEAIAVSAPSMRTVLNPTTLNEDPHLAYDAEIQYKRKPPAVRMMTPPVPGGTVSQACPRTETAP